MAQDLAAAGVELPELMTAGRWKSSSMPARYTERQAGRSGRGGQVLPGETGVVITMNAWLARLLTPRTKGHGSFAFESSIMSRHQAYRGSH